MLGDAGGFVGNVAVGRPAPDARLQGDADRELRLSELWNQVPIVLVFLRHFG
jgi:peroxiredoxin